VRVVSDIVLNYIIVKTIYTERRNSAKFKQPAIIRINPGNAGISTNIREYGLNTMRENTIGSAMHKMVSTMSNGDQIPLMIRYDTIGLTS
jgi:hypothetical protein